jgi:hypothetical protein
MAMRLTTGGRLRDIASPRETSDRAFLYTGTPGLDGYALCDGDSRVRPWRLAIALLAHAARS